LYSEEDFEFIGPARHCGKLKQSVFQIQAHCLVQDCFGKTIPIQNSKPSLPMIEYDDIYFMQQALKEAVTAYEADEVPVGAVVVINNKIIARGHNQVELLNDSTAHAEILALTSAFNKLGSKYLPNATLYVTVEPCLMCCGAMYWSKIGRIVFGTVMRRTGTNILPKRTGLSSQNRINEWHITG
jgi:tRNA(adenine34) deaminase